MPALSRGAKNETQETLLPLQTSRLSSKNTVYCCFYCCFCTTEANKTCTSRKLTVVAWILIMPEGNKWFKRTEETHFVSFVFRLLLLFPFSIFLQNDAKRFLWQHKHQIHTYKTSCIAVPESIGGGWTNSTSSLMFV